MCTVQSLKASHTWNFSGDILINNKAQFEKWAKFFSQGKVASHKLINAQLETDYALNLYILGCLSERNEITIIHIRHYFLIFDVYFEKLDSLKFTVFKSLQHLLSEIPRKI